VAGPTGATGAAGTPGILAGLVPSAGTTSVTVTIADVGSANYSVSLVTVGATAGAGIGGGNSGCVFNIDSQTSTQFVFSCRAANNGNPVTMTNGIQFEYIVVPFTVTPD
jgi:hypothetical protein